MIAGLLLKYYKVFSKLHQRQIGAQKHRYNIHAITSLVHKVQEVSAKKKLAAALFMDVKGVIDNVSRTRLVEIMIELEMDSDLIQWHSYFSQIRKCN